MPNILMIHIDTGKTADVHPNEIDHMKQYGWRESEAAPPPPPSVPPPPVPPSKRETLTIPRKGV